MACRSALLLTLCLQITQRQPQLHTEVIALIAACLTTNYSIDAGILVGLRACIVVRLLACMRATRSVANSSSPPTQRAACQCLMDRLLVLTHHGFALPVLASLVGLADDVSYTLLAYFVTEVSLLEGWL